jgi:peptidoglycan LD-endopeptidase CwlK
MNIQANNDTKIAGLVPEMQQKMRLFLSLAAKRGFTFYITDGFRSVAAQNALYAQGRTKPGKIVTYKKGGESNHNHGTAADVAPVINGKITYNEKLFNWSVIGELANEVGLGWGGFWKSFKDKPHLV